MLIGSFLLKSFKTEKSKAETNSKPKSEEKLPYNRRDLGRFRKKRQNAFAI